MKEMQKATVEVALVVVVVDADHAVFDPHGLVRIAVEWMADDLGRPPTEVLAVEEGDPAVSRGRGQRHHQGCGHQHHGGVSTAHPIGGGAWPMGWSVDGKKEPAHPRRGGLESVKH